MTLRAKLDSPGERKWRYFVRRHDPVDLVFRVDVDRAEGWSQVEKAWVDLPWERAERLARMCETKTQREVAADVGLNQGTVSIAVRAWKAEGDYPANQRRKFFEVWKEQGGSSAKFGKDGGRTPAEKANELIALTTGAEEPT